MKELHTDKLDALLSLAAAECVAEEANDFLSADVSNIPDNPKMRRKVLGVSKKTKLKALKTILLVALLSMSVMFTACMLIPEIKQIVWSIFVKNEGDHVEIDFDTSVETEAVTEPPVEVYPTAIDKKAQLTYQPEEWAIQEEDLSALQYSIFFLTDTYEFKCQFTQCVIDASNSFADNTSGQVAYVEINKRKAIIIEHEGDIPLYSLTWQDDRYRYSLYGSFSSIGELVQIAEGVSLS